MFGVLALTTTRCQCAHHDLRDGGAVASRGVGKWRRGHVAEGTHLLECLLRTLCPPLKSDSGRRVVVSPPRVGALACPARGDCMAVARRGHGHYTAVMGGHAGLQEVMGHHGNAHTCQAPALLAPCRARHLGTDVSRQTHRSRHRAAARAANDTDVGSVAVREAHHLPRGHASGSFASCGYIHRGCGDHAWKR